jgi:hypothetical protein
MGSTFHESPKDLDFTLNWDCDEKDLWDFDENQDFIKDLEFI